MRHLLILALLLSVGACASGTATQRTDSAVTTVPTMAQITSHAQGAGSATTGQAATAMPTNSPTMTATTYSAVVGPTQGLPTTTPSAVHATPVPVATGTREAIRAPKSIPGSILIAHGTEGGPTLAQVRVGGDVHSLGKLPRSIGYWDPIAVSPDGKWLAYVRAGDSHNRLVLHNLETSEEQSTLLPLAAYTVGALVFNDSSEYLAYTASADPGYPINDIHAWAIYVRDLATGTEIRLGGPGLARVHEEPLPGRPIAWIDDELLLNTFVYLGEDPNRGVWAVNMQRIAQGQDLTLQKHDRKVFDAEDMPRGLYWHPVISPGGEMLAFFLYDYEYEPHCGDDRLGGGGHLIALAVIPVTGGEPRIIVDAAEVGGALSTPLSWSYDGQQVLFAQSLCDSESGQPEWALRAVDTQGNIAGEWPSALDGANLWGEALSCTPNSLYYAPTQGELWHLDAVTGLNSQVLHSDWIRLLGCFP